mmetsp:Transcript_48747/g.122638  ORF Transcript_48747/g.122638 Transcript_48747/m.122638 type:complete len:480 (-) Transcript_48747:3691-5130(-)
MSALITDGQDLAQARVVAAHRQQRRQIAQHGRTDTAHRAQVHQGGEQTRRGRLGCRVAQTLEQVTGEREREAGVKADARDLIELGERGFEVTGTRAHQIGLDALVEEAVVVERLQDHLHQAERRREDAHVVDLQQRDRDPKHARKVARSLGQMLKEARQTEDDRHGQIAHVGGEHSPQRVLEQREHLQEEILGDQLLRAADHTQSDDGARLQGDVVGERRRGGEAQPAGVMARAHTAAARRRRGEHGQQRLGHALHVLNGCAAPAAVLGGGGRVSLALVSRDAQRHRGAGLLHGTDAEEQTELGLVKVLQVHRQLLQAVALLIGGALDARGGDQRGVQRMHQVHHQAVHAGTHLVVAGAEHHHDGVQHVGQELLHGDQVLEGEHEQQPQDHRDGRPRVVPLQRALRILRRADDQTDQASHQLAGHQLRVLAGHRHRHVLQRLHGAGTEALVRIAGAGHNALEHQAQQRVHTADRLPHLL